ncbi:NAD(P)H dehydrogenase [Pseudoneurospora amorphoporcata]|uniref:NAD(P)H dehydrogenase n=1 Tax=Pseudoneurospora amorphoporcata TaxID=241081 RepID=A0AAN6NSS7_9PEZI|nr:NAD(P)H dehydrogenase [Pseudoneurospora amorphoporcata]
MASTEAPAPASTTGTKFTTSIVILGGNLAGLGVLHTLARHTIPALQRLSSQQTSSPQQQEYQITLITPNTHFFFKPASPRALIQPLLLPGGDDSKVFPSLTDATKQYGDLVKLVVPAYAYTIDRASRLVHVRRLVDTPSPSPESTTIPYDVLVIATGTKGRSALWTMHMPGPGSHEGLKGAGAEEATRREWEGVRARLKNLQSGGAHKHHRNVLIAGGGPVGVETTGEVASWLKAEGKTEGVTVTLVSGADKLLKNKNANEKLGSKAEAYMKKQFGALVQVVHGVKVVDVQVTDSVAVSVSGGQGEGKGGEGGQTTETTTMTVHLSDGTTRTNVGLYIDATGGRGNADAFLPQSWLDASSRVITKDAYFRARGSSENDPEASGVYVAGDIVSGSDNTLIETNAQVPVVCSSIGSDLAAKILSSSAPDQNPSSPSSTSTSTSTVANNKIKLPAPLRQKTFKNKMAGTLLVPIGPGGGVGQILGWGVPSFLVKVAKAKGFLVDMAEPAVTGQQWK